MLKQARTTVKGRLASRRREPGVRLKWNEVADTEAIAPQTGSSTARSAADLLLADLLAGLLRCLSDGLEILFGNRYRASD